MSLDPRLRQRVQTIAVRPSFRQDATNPDLLEAFLRAQQGKIAQKTIENYAASIRDAIRYFQADGNEVPVRLWSKEAMWEYLHYMEANYCANFSGAPFGQEGALCRGRVWIGIMPTLDATKRHCAACPLFRKSTIKHRLNALNRFYKYLARLGVVPLNFMPDVVSEHYNDNPDMPQGERRRNPSVEEMRRLVNGTAHPMRRFYYAASAKWWMRPNEMLMLDRYASLGLANPHGQTAAGFENGFLANPQLKPYADGGDMVYIPETKGALDKRKGNRWAVADAELRPILDAALDWWDRTVKRDAEGRPVTTQLVLNTAGTALQIERMYDALFYTDCERLGLMQPGDRQRPLRRWTAHCQRHFGEKLLEMHNVPDNWCNHFRGDKLHDARGHYFKPTPDQVREKYHELVPRIGFDPTPRSAPGAAGVS